MKITLQIDNFIYGVHTTVPISKGTSIRAAKNCIGRTVQELQEKD